MKVLWLASWYPNKYEPVNGDFIQRHAIAVAQILPIHLIHVVQLGKDVVVKEERQDFVNKNLTEQINYIQYRKTGLSLFDKIQYNRFYLKRYLEILEQYFLEHGKPDLIHVHVPMKAGWVALAIKKKYNIPYIVSEHGSYYDEAAPDTFSKRSFFFKRNTKKVCQNATAVTNVSTLIGSKMKALFHLNEVVTIHNVVDTNLFYYLPLENQNEFVWIHVSTLGEQKNIEGLFTAFSAFAKQSNQNQKLMMVGPSNNYHLELAKKNKIENLVEFVGEVPHQKVAFYMQQANAFVLFSKHENFPCVIIEALCCGLPIISSNVGGLAEALNSQNGILVTNEKLEQLENAFSTMITEYHAYDRKAISNDAKSKYSYNTIANQFYKLYNEKVKQHF